MKSSHSLHVEPVSMPLSRIALSWEHSQNPQLLVAMRDRVGNSPAIEVSSAGALLRGKRRVPEPSSTGLRIF